MRLITSSQQKIVKLVKQFKGLPQSLIDPPFRITLLRSTIPQAMKSNSQKPLINSYKKTMSKIKLYKMHICLKILLSFSKSQEPKEQNTTAMHVSSFLKEPKRISAMVIYKLLSKNTIKPKNVILSSVKTSKAIPLTLNFIELKL